MTLTDWQARHGVSDAAMEELRALFLPTVKSSDTGSEARVQSETRLAAVKHGALWRNNAGQAELNGQPVRFGLGNDSKKFWHNWRSGDLVGITRMVVKPHHVGRTVAVFTMMEVKHPGWTKPTDERERAQMNCLTHVASLGGLAGFVASVEDYERYVTEYVK